jgi:hypothetical protein
MASVFLHGHVYEKIIVSLLFTGVGKKIKLWMERKGFEDLALWKEAINNHIYWCAATSNGISSIYYVI